MDTPSLWIQRYSFSLSHILNCGRRHCQNAGKYISHEEAFLQDNKKFSNYQ
jgi:hypothetical protein